MFQDWRELKMGPVKTVSNTAQVRNYNIEIVKNALKAIPSGTKNTISQLTGLSVATCNTLLNELAASGEILEVTEPVNANSVGRPAKAYRFNEHFSYILCMYATTIGGKRKLHYGVMDLLGQVIESDCVAKPLLDYFEISDYIASIIEKYPSIHAIGFGIPGIVNRRMEVEACDIEALNECPLRERLEEQFGVNVVVDNDMNLIAYGFYQEESPEEESSMALVSFFEKVCAGCGIIINGTIFHGSTNFAGEVSYLPFEISHTEQVKLLDTKEGILKLTSKTISSLAAVINPTQIVLTGSPIKEDMMEELAALCEKDIPKQHMPKLRYSSDINNYYLKGLCALTLEYVQNPYK